MSKGIWKNTKSIFVVWWKEWQGRKEGFMKIRSSWGVLERHTSLSTPEQFGNTPPDYSSFPEQWVLPKDPLFVKATIWIGIRKKVSMSRKKKKRTINEMTWNVNLPGFGSANSCIIVSNTLLIVNAGDQLLLMVSRQIIPLELILQW